MSNISTTISPTNVPSLPVKGNVSSLANRDTLNTLNSIQSPTTFGDQAKAGGQQVVKAIGDSTLIKLQKEKVALIQEGIQLDITHQQTLLKLQQQNTPSKKVENGQTVEIPPQLSDEEYQQAVDNENKNYEEAKKILQEKKDKNQKDLDDFLKDPFKKQKEETKKRKEARKKAQSRNNAERNRARKEKINAILKNGRKTLVPILTLLISNKIADIISQNQKIKKLVNDTNDIITEANTSGDPTKLSNAKLARDNAIKIIQSNEEKIKAIQEQIQRISVYINIFTVIVTIISAIPIPTSVPPGVGIPTSLIIKFVKILEKANKVLLALSALIPILLSSLSKAISILQDLKSQLLDINGQLDNAATSDTLESTSLLSSPTEFGVAQTEYKGFKFAIKEENNPKFVIRGFKRHYAVAIDANGVEVIRSEYSFTLDPNDLIEQLKLIIDQQGLTTSSNSLGPKPQSLSSTSQSPTGTTTQTPTATFQIASSSSISKAQSAVKKQPPKPVVIVGPAGGTTAKIPLGVVEKARLIALAAASGPNPAPKIDVAFIIAADQKWQAEYKKYQKSAISGITGLPS